MTSDDRAPKFGIRVQRAGETEAIFQEDVSEFVTSFTFEDNAKLVDKATFSLDNHDLRWIDHPSFRHNNLVEVQWGYGGRMTPLRRCVIAALKGGFPILTVDALGHAMKMDEKTKTRTFTNLTRSAVVQKIAEEHGFAKDAEIEDTKVVYSSISQAGRTDAAFVKWLADREGFQFFVGQSGLHFHRRDLKQQPIKELFWFSTRGDGDLITLDYEEDHKAKTGKHGMTARDPFTKKTFEVVASNKETPRGTLGTVETAISRAEVSESTGTLAPGIIIVKDETKPTSEPTAQAAKRAVDGDYHTGKHKAIKLKGTMIGDPDIAARRIVVISGIGSRLSGRWYLTKVVHKIDKDGYITEFECERDTHNGYKDTKRDVKTKGTPNVKPVKAPQALLPTAQVNAATGEVEKNGWRPANTGD
jgi:phage protein D